MSTLVYHNPRCSKSRQAVELLQEKGITFEIKEYLKEGLSIEEIKSLISALGEEASNIVRAKEDEFKESPFCTKDYDIVAQKLHDNPKLLERPIVVVEGSAVIGRPPENVLKLFK